MTKKKQAKAKSGGNSAVKAAKKKSPARKARPKPSGQNAKKSAGKAGETATTPKVKTTARAKTKTVDYTNSRNSTEREARIRALAYKMWEQAGRPPGNGVDFWHTAETKVDAES